MKLVTAIIRPLSLEPVKDELENAGITGMTITEAKGFGSQGGHKEVYRGTEYSVSFLQKAKIEILVEDNLVDKTIEAICSAARTGNVGDGKIWVSDVNRIVRVRTGEEGQEAI